VETEIGLVRNDGKVIYGGYTVPSNNVPFPWHATLAVNPAPQPGAQFPYTGSWVGLAWGYPGTLSISYSTDNVLQVNIQWAMYPITSGSVQLNTLEQMVNVKVAFTHGGWYLSFLRTVDGLNQEFYMLFDQDGKGFRGHFLYDNSIFPLEGTRMPS